MATAPEQVGPVFGDALAGNSGMADPVPPARSRTPGEVGSGRAGTVSSDTGSSGTGFGDSGFDVFPDALAALPLPALTFVLPPVGAQPAGAGGPGGPGFPAAAPGRSAPGRSAPARPAPTRAPAPAPARQFAPPSGPSWAGYPPPGQPTGLQPPQIAAAPPYSRPGRQPGVGGPAGSRGAANGTVAKGPTAGRPASTASGVLAPGTGRRPVAGFGYTPPPTSGPGVVRPPAYLPQNQGMAQLRAAVQQARGARNRPPASAPSAVRPSPPTRARRTGRASSAWSVFVFLLILLISTGLGHNIIDAVSRLLHHR